MNAVNSSPHLVTSAVFPCSTATVTTSIYKEAVTELQNGYRYMLPKSQSKTEGPSIRATPSKGARRLIHPAGGCRGWCWVWRCSTS
jgi:hypothetical protein